MVHDFVEEKDTPKFVRWKYEYLATIYSFVRQKLIQHNHWQSKV